MSFGGCDKAYLSFGALSVVVRLSIQAFKWIKVEIVKLIMWGSPALTCFFQFLAKLPFVSILKWKKNRFTVYIEFSHSFD